METRGPSLVWRVFAANAVVLVVASLILLLAPVTVSNPVSAGEAVVVLVGLCVMLLADLWLLRRALAPVERLADAMDAVDLLEPTTRPLVLETPDPEVARLAHAFDAMLRRLQDERRAAAGHAARGQEDERRRVARELHDGVGQTLTALLLQVDQAARRVPGEAAADLEELRDAVRRCLEDVRSIARGLRPEVLDDLGLPSALKALATAFARSTGIPVVRRIAPDLPPLGQERELAAYRIAQEGLANAARHARATEVEVRLERVPRGVRLSVRDDGVGLPPLEATTAGGLRSMRERALLVGGELRLARPPGGGTLVELLLPLGPGQRPDRREEPRALLAAGPASAGMES
jgi:two-component system sensor histidine kinase UhpB